MTVHYTLCILSLCFINWICVCPSVSVFCFRFHTCPLQLFLGCPGQLSGVQQGWVHSVSDLRRAPEEARLGHLWVPVRGQEHLLRVLCESLGFSLSAMLLFFPLNSLLLSSLFPSLLLSFSPLLSSCLLSCLLFSSPLFFPPWKRLCSEALRWCKMDAVSLD